MHLNQLASQLLDAGRTLNHALGEIRFHSPVTRVYRPLEYAWAPYEEYIKRYGSTPKKILFLGMNPGPWGMAQTGIPFGDIHAVRDWLSIHKPFPPPENTHPARPVLGFGSIRSEVSGKRLWGLFRDQFQDPGSFFVQHFVANYCPVLFLDERGKNLTPERLNSEDRSALIHPCDAHLQRVVEILKVQWVVGIGKYAENQATRALKESPLRVAGILHPSPANPSANRGWSEKALTQLRESGIW